MELGKAKGTELIMNLDGPGNKMCSCGIEVTGAEVCQSSTQTEHGIVDENRG